MKIWLWLLALLLLSALTLTGALGLWARQYYLELNSVRLDPLGQTVYASATALPKTAPVRLLFYGDSRAYAWPAPTGLEDWEVLNRGIGGQTTAQILGRFAEDVTPLQPDVVLIQAGINDLKTIGLFPERTAAIVATCKENLAAMVQRATAQGATVIVTTVFPTAQPSLLRRPFWSAAIGAAVVDVNQFLQTLASDRVIIFDSAGLLSDDAGRLRPEYSYDLLHLNQNGYDALNAELRVVLAERKFEDNHVR
jgi:lysophospholipase L1-like esterase